MVRSSAVQQYLVVGVLITLCLGAHYAESQTQSETTETFTLEGETGETVTPTAQSTGHFQTCPSVYIEGDYCNGGVCQYLPEHPNQSDRISCRCLPSMTGPRCLVSNPDFSTGRVKQALRTSYIVIGVLVALLVLVAIPAVAFFRRRSRSNREASMDGQESGSSATLMGP